MRRWRRCKKKIGGIFIGNSFLRLFCSRWAFKRKQDFQNGQRHGRWVTGGYM